MRGGPGYVEFHDGTRLPFDQPRDTMDPRYPQCTDHRTACICREAEWSEEVNEFRSEWRGFRRALAAVIHGHPVEVCRCTACEIARRVGLTHLAIFDTTKEQP